MSEQSSMSQPDFMAWRLEGDPVMRSTIVAFALLDSAPDGDRLTAAALRATGLVDMFRSKAVPDPLGLAPPRWILDPDFEVSWHLRRLTVPEPTYESLFDFVSSEAMDDFDKDRPLWRFTVLEGLPEGRAALVMKVHHSLTDGVGGMEIAQHLVDFTREGDHRAGAEDAGGEAAADKSGGDVPPAADSPQPWTGSRLARYAGVLVSLLRHTLTLIALVCRKFVRNPVRSVKGAVAMATSAGKFAQPVLTTRSPVMVERSTHRDVAVVDVSLDALHTAADAVGVSVNDAFLAAVLYGMAHYHDRHGSDAPKLRVTVPINIRSESDPIGGNRITLARMLLPSANEDAASLMREVHGTVAQWRDEPAIPHFSAIAGALNVLPPAFLGAMFKHTDFLASNVPGSPVQAFLGGAEILSLYAFGPTLGSSFNVTLMSHRDRCCVGIHADAAAVPDLEDCKAAIVEGFEAVLACAGDAQVPEHAIRTSLEGPRH